MASLPNNTYYSPNNSFFLANTTNPVFSTITATRAISIDGQAGQTWDVIANESGQINQLAQTEYPNTIQTDWVQNAGTFTQQQYTVSTGDERVIHAYFYDEILKGSLTFENTINGPNGGVQLVSENGTSLAVSDGGVTIIGETGSNGNLTFFLQNASNAFIQQKTPNGDLASQIHFNSEIESVTLVSATGQSIGVGPNTSNVGIVLNPGTDSNVLMNTGRLDMNSSAIINVSSINTTHLPTTVETLTPLIPGSNPFVFASNAANFEIATFSNLTPSEIYRVGFSGSFECVTNVTPNADAFFRISAFGTGPDAEAITTINANSITQFGNIPGTLGAASAFYSFTFTPLQSTYTIYANAGPTLNTDIEMFVGSFYLEKLL
jgi:hypothetical protein